MNSMHPYTALIAAAQPIIRPSDRPRLRAYGSLQMTKTFALNTFVSGTSRPE
jgi:hypothetical protein